MSSHNHNFPELEEILQGNPGWLDEAIDTPSVSQLTGVPICTLTTWRRPVLDVGLRGTLYRPRRGDP